MIKQETTIKKRFCFASEPFSVIYNQSEGKLL